MNNNLTTYSIKDLLQISLPVFKDGRGFFKEIVRFNEIEKVIGRQFLAKQINHARSVKNTLRGIHVAPWNKIVYVTKGSAQIIAVDCQEGSPTFGKYESIILGDDNGSCVFIPAGFGNSYLVLSDEADYVYITDREWSPNQEKDIIWNDKNLKINWQLKEGPFLSERDKNGLPFFSVFSLGL
jgi:dTDP-4-dehydrorhamnose 3,5-epimerase